MRTLLGMLLLAVAAFAQEPLITRLDHVTVFVKDYDEALKWYTEMLGLEKTADAAFGKGERWLTVAPKGDSGVQIVLAKMGGPRAELTGKQALWIFRTADCQKAYEALRARGVKFRHAPVKAPWGIEATFEDLYGNEFVIYSER